jgi:uncharacterized membrane protein
MKRAEFLAALRENLADLPPHEIDDIVADYAQYFTDGVTAGRSEDDVAAALGEPRRLAKELRAEAGLRRWNEHRNAGNLAAAVFALIGLATVDLVFLLPVLFVIGLLLFVFGVVMFALLIAGVALVISMLGFGFFGFGGFARGLTGAGLVASAIAGGAILLLFLDALVRVLGRYTRLHYRLLRPSR